MATISNASTDAVPLLGRGGRLFARRPSLRPVALFLRRAASRRMMRQPPTLRRAGAAERLEALHGDWASARRTVLLDILWNLSFVAVAAGVLMFSFKESPELPLRLWIVGYAMECVLRVVCLCLAYWKRITGVRGQVDEESSESGSSGDVEEGEYGAENGRDEENVSIAKHLESANTVFSLIWWIIGLYWLSSGGQPQTHDAPQLYWLCIIFLAFDVLFVALCVILGCIIGAAVCCCLPCIIAILYAVTDQQDGASDEDIRQLPKYKFRRMVDPEKFATEISGPCGGVVTECDSDPPVEHVLPPENAECCICISPYDDGVELRELPCSHRFHCTCIEKWLHINATCPLCKYNILKRSNHVEEEV